MINLDTTPYSLDGKAEQQILAEIKKLEERVDLLRRQGTLTQETLQRFYGMKRFELIAESNAIEGSTLSVGETELAVLKGITITGHDLGYVRDAVALDKAHQRLTELAKDSSPTDLKQIREIHELILGSRPSAGLFRRERVKIKGLKHTPPKTWEEVMNSMENWEKWSQENSQLPAVIRATVLQAWFVHIHPFIDGNGRTARALTNLEFVRSGYPSIIIRKKERYRYIEALGVSDEGGDLTDFFELIISRANDALRGLEQAAKRTRSVQAGIPTRSVGTRKTY
jgi:Fic family protein